MFTTTGSSSPSIATTHLVNMSAESSPARAAQAMKNRSVFIKPSNGSSEVAFGGLPRKMPVPVPEATGDTQVEAA